MKIASLALAVAVLIYIDASQPQAVAFQEEAGDARVTTLRGKYGVFSLAFSHDGRRLVAGGYYKDPERAAERHGPNSEGAVALWDLSARKVVAEKTIKRGPRPDQIAFAAADRTVTASYDDEVITWKPAANKGVEFHRLPGPPPDSLASALSPTCDRLARSTREGIEVWDFPGKDRVALLPGKLCSVMAFSADGKSLVTTSEYDTREEFARTPAEDIGKVQGPIFPLNFGGEVARDPRYPDGVTIWDLDRSKARARFRVTRGKVGFASLSRDGSLLALVQDTKPSTVQLWDGSAGRHLADLKGHASDVVYLAFSPSGRLLASADVGDVAAGRVKGPAVVRVWDATASREMGVYRLDGWGSVSALAFSHDGKRLAVGRGDEQIAIITLDGP